jgi:twitching motility two-component system response regulator PilH
VPDISAPPRDVPTPTILLVDAHEDSRYIYTAALGHHGFRVVASACCEEGLEMARAERPHLIVLAVATTAAPAWRTLRALKEHGDTAGIPVLAVSTTGLPEHRALALQMGCAAFLVKPLPPLDLLAEARRVLALTKSA